MSGRSRQKIELEQYILGAFLLERHAFNWVGHLIQPEDLSVLEEFDHSEIFAVMQQLYPRYDINVRTVDFYTHRKYSLYLRELVSPVCSIGSLPHGILHLHCLNILEDTKKILTKHALSPGITIDEIKIIQELISMNEVVDECEAISYLDEVNTLAIEGELSAELTEELSDVINEYYTRFKQCERSTAIYTLLENIKSFSAIPVSLKVKEELQRNVDSILTILSTGDLPRTK